LSFHAKMFSHSNSLHGPNTSSESVLHLGTLRPTPEVKLNSKDGYPATIEGCLQEIGRTAEIEKQYFREIAKLVNRRQKLFSIIQKLMGKSPPSFAHREKQVFIEPEELTKNIAPLFYKAFSGDDSGVCSSYEELPSQQSSDTFRRVAGRYKTNPELLKVFGRSRKNAFQWDKVRLQPTFYEPTVKSTLISTLKKLKWQNRDFKHIRRWCKALTNLFYEADEDGNCSIEEPEFRKMIDKLPLSDILKDSLRNQFKEINVDNSGGISLAEFLFFFLQYQPFRVELNDNFYNEPYLGQHNLSCLQRARVLIYKTITVTDFNSFSRVLQCLDLGFTLVPLITLLIYAVSPSMENTLHWNEDFYLWFTSIFFALHWLLGVSLCSSRATYLTRSRHIMELISFLPWIILKGSGIIDGDVRMNGFVLCRLLRANQLALIFPSMFTSLKSQIAV